MPERIENPEPHKHEWEYYDGCLGYESLVCQICGWDINETSDLTAEKMLTAKELREEKEEAEAKADLYRKYEAD